MEIILALLLWLGIISKPAEATDQLIKENSALIQNSLTDYKTEAAIGPPIIHILEDQE